MAGISQGGTEQGGRNAGRDVRRGGGEEEGRKRGVAEEKRGMWAKLAVERRESQETVG